MSEITIQDILECQEQTQQDLIAFLDGLPQETLDHVCQIVVDNMKKMKDKCPNEKDYSTRSGSDSRKVLGSCY